jgi:hypothetical protein
MFFPAALPIAYTKKYQLHCDFCFVFADFCYQQSLGYLIMDHGQKTDIHDICWLVQCDNGQMLYGVNSL